MQNVPFASTNILRQRNLPIPSREQTMQALCLLNLNEACPLNPQLEGYRLLYGIDKLAAQHWQGYLDVAQFRVHVQVFSPQSLETTQIKGTVWLIHGYLEHSAIYQPIIAEILQQGFSVVCYDLAGHGLSSGTIAGIDDFKDYQTVLLALKEHLESAQQLPKPWLGMGQSTGGAIWLHHLLDYAERKREPMIERVLLLSPLVRPAKSAWWHNSVGLSLLSKIKQRVPRTFRRNNHNPEFLRFVRLEDPLQPRSMSMSWILAMARWVSEMELRPPCRIPVWMAQGARDQTVDWRYNIEYIRRHFRLQTLLMLEEGSHQLINERADIRAALTGLIPAFLHAHKSKHYYWG